MGLRLLFYDCNRAVPVTKGLKEVTKMALSNIFGWNNGVKASACGSACGASEKPEEKPTACGSACGASDK